MQAIVQDTYGTAAVLHARDIEKPEIGERRGPHPRPRRGRQHRRLGDHERAAVHRPTGLRPASSPRTACAAPTSPGSSRRSAPASRRFKAGDEVFGWANGSYAEYSVSTEDSLALKPANLTFEAAAAVPMAGLVALQALRDHAKVGPGTTVLVNGASGGIGTFAVQIAKALGAEVTAVTSTRNLELVRSIGADHVIDYTTEDFTQSGRQYDVILDNVSNHSLADLRRVLTPTGTLIPNGGRLRQPLARQRRPDRARGRAVPVRWPDARQLPHVDRITPTSRRSPR